MATKKRNKVKIDEQIEKVSKSSKKKAGMSIWRFAFTYLALMVAFYLLIGVKPIQNIIDLNGLYTKGVVIITSKILEMINVPSSYQGSFINLPSIVLDVGFGCNGLEAVMIYSGAVIAFPSLWKYKLMGIVGGFLAIQVINIVRIVLLAYCAVYLKSLFDYIHIYIAQGIMIAISLGVFFIYLNYAKSSQKATI
jgi:exosortase/archaeosortase family protein